MLHQTQRLSQLTVRSQCSSCDSRCFTSQQKIKMGSHLSFRLLIFTLRMRLWSPFPTGVRTFANVSLELILRERDDPSHSGLTHFTAVLKINDGYVCVDYFVLASLHCTCWLMWHGVFSHCKWCKSFPTHVLPLLWQSKHLASKLLLAKFSQTIYSDWASCLLRCRLRRLVNVFYLRNL